MSKVFNYYYSNSCKLQYNETSSFTNFEVIGLINKYFSCSNLWDEELFILFSLVCEFLQLERYSLQPKYKLKHTFQLHRKTFVADINKPAAFQVDYCSKICPVNFSRFKTCWHKRHWKPMHTKLACLK